MEDLVADMGRNANAAGQQGQEAAERAASEASQVADTAKDQARQVKDEVATQARGLVDQAKSELRDQGRSQADQAEALAAGRVDEAGNVADYVRKAGDQVGRVADRLDQRGIDGVVDDVQAFARRRPGAFLLGCAAAGFVTGRLLRGGAAGSGGLNGDAG